MTDLRKLISGLKSSDNRYAYSCLTKLSEESKKSDIVYKYFDVFCEMIEDNNSFVRTRGITLIAYNAKWDKDNRIDEMIDRLFMHITDVKPITARQCIKVLPIIAEYKPDLENDIINALNHADTCIYKDSMQSLVVKDIKKAFDEIEKL